MKRKVLIFSILLCCCVFPLAGCENKTDKTSENENNVSNTTIEMNENYVYSVSNEEMYIGNIPSKYGEIYATPEEAISALSHNFFIRHTIEDEEIKESYLGFKYNDKFYYIKGSDSNLYTENQEELKEIFGKSNCITHSYYMTCEDANLSISIKDDGYVGINDGEAYCNVFDNYSKCKIGGLN